jgi:SAM-dependent methyltransferase
LDCFAHFNLRLTLPEIRSSLAAAVRNWWRDQRQSAGIIATARRLTTIGFQFLRDSLPDRRRQRFGDIDYDWEHRVDTTSANVSWQSRLVGLLSSPYQPIDPDLFRETMKNANVDPSHFTFIDIGSGKGRALLLAAEYPFQRVIGIELLPELDEVARANIAKFSRRNPECGPIESICCDATEFVLPEVPSLIFLNNPLPHAELSRLVRKLESSVQTAPRDILLLYANPILERVLKHSNIFRKSVSTHQYAIFRNDISR